MDLSGRNRHGNGHENGHPNPYDSTNTEPKRNIDYDTWEVPQRMPAYSNLANFFGNDAQSVPFMDYTSQGLDDSASRSASTTTHHSNSKYMNYGSQVPNFSGLPGSAPTPSLQLLSNQPVNHECRVSSASYKRPTSVVVLPVGMFAQEEDLITQSNKRARTLPYVPIPVAEAANKVVALAEKSPAPPTTDSNEPFVNKHRSQVYFALEHSKMDGRIVIEAYKKFAMSGGQDDKIFDKYRSKLAKCIISYDMAHVSYNVSHERMQELLKDLIELMPLEKKHASFYYDAAACTSDKTRGMFVTQVKHYREEGNQTNLQFIKAARRSTSKKKKENEVDDVLLFSLKTIKKVDDDSLSLFHSSLPQIIHFMEVKITKLSFFYDYFSCLKLPEAYKLILPNHDSETFVSKWKSIAEKVIDVVRKKKNIEQNPSTKKKLQYLLNLNVLDAYNIALLVFPYIFSGRSAHNKNFVREKALPWFVDYKERTSTETIESIIRNQHETLEQSAPDVDVLPHVLVIANKSNETRCVRNFLILNASCYYEIDSVLKAVQYCFECIRFLKPIFGKDIYGKIIPNVWQTIEYLCGYQMSKSRYSAVNEVIMKLDLEKLFDKPVED